MGVRKGVSSFCLLTPRDRFVSFECRDFDTHLVTALMSRVQQKKPPRGARSLPELSELAAFFAGVLGLAGVVLTGAGLAGSRRGALAELHQASTQRRPQATPYRYFSHLVPPLPRHCCLRSCRPWPWVGGLLLLLRRRGQVAGQRCTLLTR